MSENKCCDEIVVKLLSIVRHISTLVHHISLLLFYYHEKLGIEYTSELVNATQVAYMIYQQLQKLMQHIKEVRGDE